MISLSHSKMCPILSFFIQKMSTCNVTTVVGKEYLKENARSDLEGENVYGTESVAQRCFFKKNLLKISKYSLENTKVTLEIFFIFSIENRLQHRCFLVDFAKILRAAPVQNTSGWLFLRVVLAPFIIINNCYWNITTCHNYGVSYRNDFIT